MAILHVVGVDHLPILGERPTEPVSMERTEVRLKAPIDRAANHEANGVLGQVADVARCRGRRHHHPMGFHEDSRTGYQLACQLLLVDFRAYLSIATTDLPDWGNRAQIALEINCALFTTLVETRPVASLHCLFNLFL